MRDRLPFVFILITLLLDAMGIGLILPVMPDFFARSLARISHARPFGEGG